MKRYQRQLMLSECGAEGQLFLQHSRVLIIGAGGLGTAVAQYLGAAGIGTLMVVDGDVVQETNLHRQVLFRSEDVGQNKAQVLAERLRSQNKELTIEAIPRFLDKAMALQIFETVSLIVDGTDNFQTKFLINDVACLYSKPVVFAAISRFEGQLSVFWRSQGPCYRCFLPTRPQSKIGTCSEAGVLGPMPGILGTLQAMEALKVLLWQCGTGRGLLPLIGKVQFFDFASNEQRTLKLRRRSGCLCHSEDWSSAVINDIFMEEAGLCDAPLASQDLIDVRTTEEWNAFHIEGSLHWPLARIEELQAPRLDPSKKYGLICQSGVRAARAQKILEQLGYSNIRVIMRSVYDYSP